MNDTKTKHHRCRRRCRRRSSEAAHNNSNEICGCCDDNDDDDGNYEFKGIYLDWTAAHALHIYHKPPTLAVCLTWMLRTVNTHTHTFIRQSPFLKHLNQNRKGRKVLLSIVAIVSFIWSRKRRHESKMWLLWLDPMFVCVYMIWSDGDNDDFWLFIFDSGKCRL